MLHFSIGESSQPRELHVGEYLCHSHSIVFWQPSCILFPPLTSYVPSDFWLENFCTYSPLYSSIFLALASLYIKKQNNMQAAVNKRAYFGKTAPILLRPRLLNQHFNKKWMNRSCHVKVRVFSMTGYFQILPYGP